MAAPCRSCRDGRSNPDDPSSLRDDDIRGVPNDAEIVGWTNENASVKTDVAVVDDEQLTEDHPTTPTNARRESSGDVEIIMGDS